MTRRFTPAVTLFVLTALVALGATGSLVVAAANKPAPTFSDSGPEPLLSKILIEIEQNRLDAALEQTEELLQQYPKFRLAHLIKGDLLLARSTPLSTFGNAKNAPQEKLSDLRDEVVARLKAYRSRQATVDYVPRYLMQM